MYNLTTGVPSFKTNSVSFSGPDLEEVGSFQGSHAGISNITATCLAISNSGLVVNTIGSQLFVATLQSAALSIARLQKTRNHGLGPVHANYGSTRYVLSMYHEWIASVSGFTLFTLFRVGITLSLGRDQPDH